VKKLALRVVALTAMLFAGHILVGQTPDTTQVRALHEKALSFLSTYPDSLRFYRDSSHVVAVQLHDRMGVAESFTDLGIYYWLKGDYAAAIQAYDSSNLVYDELKKPTKKMKNLSNLGMVYGRLGDFPRAIQSLLESLRISEAMGAKEAQAKTYNSLGVAHKNQGNIDEAFVAYNKSLALFKEVNQPENVAGSYSNIGNLYMLRKDLDQGLAYQVKALSIFDSLKNFRGIITCYNNISDIHLSKGQPEKALRYREQALDLSHNHGFFSSEVVALSGIGNIYAELRDYKTAEANFLKGLALASQKKYRTEMVNLYKGLSNCYKMMGKNTEALRYHELYAAMKDSLFNQQTLTTISNLQTSFELKKKQDAIELLKRDNQIATLSRNRTIIVSVALLFIAFLLLVWQRSRMRHHRQIHAHEKKLYEIEQALTRAELESAKLKESELLKELSYKNKSLTTYALTMVQKNEILEEVKESIGLLLKKPEHQEDHFKKLSRIVDYGFTVDKDWDDFKLYFEEVHADFFLKLKERYPDLGGADLKLCALIRLNLNVKQTAAILRISPDSVKVARHRLRKKFNLQTEDNLPDFIMLL
jgi:tetratricopeptide (TPR) repeat protein